MDKLFGLSLKTFIFSLLLTLNGFSQDLSIPIGSDTDNEGGSTIVLGPSGDYFIGGYSESKGMVSRVGSDGTVIWSKSVDFGADPDYMMELEITSDNFLIGCGNARTGASFNAYGFVFKMDLDGNIVWSRRVVCDDKYVWMNGLVEASNGNYRVAGSYKNVRLNNYLIEYDSGTGAQVWDTVYVRSNIANGWDESFYDLVTHPTNDATYIGGRFQKAATNTTYRASLTKVSATGGLEWSKTYLYNDATSGGRYYCFSIDQDGDSLVMGLLCRDGGGSPPFETGLIKTDLDGNIGWAKLYTGPGNDLRSYNMVNVADGYLITGWLATGDKSLFMIKTDNSGNVVWSKSYGGTGDEEAHVASSNSRVIVDGSYAVTVGRTNSFGGDYDIFLVKADLATGELSDGGCFEDLTIVETVLPNFQDDYPMITLNLPITSTNPVMPVDDLIFDYSGGLFDELADTLVDGDTIYLCPGDEINFLADWDDSFDYLWNTGGTDQVETVSETGVYWVDVSAGGCLMWSDTVTVILDPVAVDLGADTSICDMATYTIDAGFVDGASYLWNDGSTDQTLFVDVDGWYWVTLENDVCSFTDSIYIEFGFIELEIGTDTIVCFGETVVLDAANPGATYLWNDGSTEQTLEVTETGVYWVVVNDGCVISDTINVSVSDVRVDLVSDTILCNGTTLLLDAGVIAGAAYLWNDGSTDQTFLVDEAGTYSVVVSDGTCSHSDEVTVTYFEPFANFEGDPLTGCAPLSVDFTDLSTTPYGVIDEWYWSFGDGSISFLDNPDHVYISPGVFDVTLTVTTDLGCEDDTTIANYITVGENVTANFSYTPDYITAGDLVTFTNLSTNATSWFWDFGDGETSYEEHPQHVFEGTGEYMITLTSMNGSGCNETVVYTFIVREAIYIFIPNVFTPDGDDFNENWKPSIYGIDIYDFHLMLFNRWGEIIWESFDSNVGWDGTYGGKLVQDGVYVWKIEYGDRWTDEQFQLNGHVTVLK